MTIAARMAEIALRIHIAGSVVHRMLIATRENRSLSRRAVLKIPMAQGAIAVIVLGIILIPLIGKARMAGENNDEEHYSCLYRP